MKTRSVSSSLIICAGLFIILTISQPLSFLPTRSPSSDVSYDIKEAGRVLDIAIPPVSPPASKGIVCDRKHFRYDFCMLYGPTIMSPSNSTFSLMGHTQQTEVQKIRPYPRKWESDAMSRIREISLSVTSQEASCRCQVWHDAPAIVFSNHGYINNFYHAVADGFVPLFVTTRTVFGHNRTPILVVSRIRPWWLTRYVHLLNELTSYPIINLDNETRIHCFPTVAVGLIAHGDMTINPNLMPNSESLRDFHALVHRSYQDKTLQEPMPTPPNLSLDHGKNPRPQLVLLARTSGLSRVIVNQAQLVKAAEEAGFEVHIFEPNDNTTLRSAHKLVSASHALIGVHGAALTHLFFLRAGAVFIQVVPLGLERVAKVCFASPALEIGLEYMEYKINIEESTLVEKFDRDDEVLKNPESFAKKGWNYTALFLKQQDIRLDPMRFKSYLELAYYKAMKLMSRENRF